MVVPCENNAFSFIHRIHVDNIQYTKYTNRNEEAKNEEMEKNLFFLCRGQ